MFITYLLRIYFYFLFVCRHMYTHACICSTHGSQKKDIRISEAVVSFLSWDLGTELMSPGRVVLLSTAGHLPSLYIHFLNDLFCKQWVIDGALVFNNSCRPNWILISNILLSLKGWVFLYFRCAQKTTVIWYILAHYVVDLL